MEVRALTLARLLATGTQGFTALFMQPETTREPPPSGRPKVGPSPRMMLFHSGAGLDFTVTRGQRQGLVS